MKSQISLIALLTFTALAMALALILTPQRNPVQADVLAPAGDLSFLTSTGGSSTLSYVSMLNVVDDRDGLLLTYTLNGQQLQLLGVYNLASRVNPPPLH